MATSGAEPSFRLGVSQTPLPDVEILTKLSTLYVAIQRYRIDAASCRQRRRRQRDQIAQAEALLHVDSAALRALQAEPEPDQVTLGILNEAVAGDQRAYEHATGTNARSNDTVEPELVHTMDAVADTERQAMELRRALSPPATRLLDGLLRKKTLPLISYISGRTCAECHLGLPTALTAAVRRKAGLHWCPHCKRLLLDRSGEADARKDSK